MVLVRLRFCFFLLSGFSIHYASLARDMTRWAGVVDYCYLRFRRIYPIFLISIALTITLYALGAAVGIGRYQSLLDTLTPGRLAANLAFLADRNHIPGTVAAVLDTNAPLWSLAYEVPYYFTYPLVWRIAGRFGARGIAALGVAASIVAVICAQLWGANHLSNIFALYFCWCLGAVIAECKRMGLVIPFTRFWWVGLMTVGLMLALAIRYSRAAWLSEPLWAGVFFLLLGYPVMSAATAPMTTRERAVAMAGTVMFAGLLLAASFRYAFADRIEVFRAEIVVVLGIAVAAIITDATAGLVRGAHRALIVTCFALGEIPDALYVVHYPILNIFAAAFQQFELPRALVIVALPVPFLLALSLEKHLQPLLNRALDRSYRLLKEGVGLRPEIAR